jgi:hypothetical protein
MNFLREGNENTQNEHCFISQEAHMYTLWGHVNKLSHGFDSAEVYLFHERCMESSRHLNSWWFVHKIWYIILYNSCGPIELQIFGSFFTKNPFLTVWKIENELFMQRKEKNPKWILLSIPSRTHVHNTGSFE